MTLNEMIDALVNIRMRHPEHADAPIEPYLRNLCEMLDADDDFIMYTREPILVGEGTEFPAVYLPLELKEDYDD